MRRVLWIQPRGSSDQKKEIIAAAVEQGFLDIVLSEEEEEHYTSIGRFNPILRSEDGFSREGRLIGTYARIQDGGDQDEILARTIETPFLVISTTDWSVIPVENLIAHFQQKKTQLLVEVESIRDMSLMLQTLEAGTDGVLFTTEEPAILSNLQTYVAAAEPDPFSLVSATISRVASRGLGDRVCVDTCSMMETGEGMLVGSQASGLFLVHAESVESSFVATRPFRVNAGAVHSYIQVEGGKTRYLSELRAGDTALIVNANGRSRMSIVGRVKVERRPFLLLEAEYEGNTYSALFQNAETIRLVSDGQPVSIVELSNGSPVLMKVEAGGTHFGKRIEEHIIER